MPTSKSRAAAAASAKQAVIVHVHTAAPKKATRRRAVRRAAGKSAPMVQSQGAAAAMMNGPAQSVGRFYVNPPMPVMPRLISENVGFAPSPLLGERISNTAAIPRAAASSTIETPVPVSPPSPTPLPTPARPTPARPTPPRSAENIFDGQTPATAALTPIPPVGRAAPPSPTLELFGHIPYQSFEPDHTAEFMARLDALKDLRPEALTRHPARNEQLPPAPTPLGGPANQPNPHATRATGTEDLAPPLGYTPTFTGRNASARLQAFLEASDAEQITNWFANSNSKRFVQRAQQHDPTQGDKLNELIMARLEAYGGDFTERSGRVMDLDE